MPLYFIQIVYRDGGTISDVDSEIKFFKNDYEIDNFKKSPKPFRGKVELVKQISSIDEIFINNDDLYSREKFVAYYEELRWSLGDKLDFFPKPDFSDAYIEKILNLREEQINEIMNSEEYDKYYREQSHGDPFGWMPDWEHFTR